VKFELLTDLILVNETAVMRWNYGDPQLGTCKETFNGGNHFRYWIQNGPKQNTGAVFLACVPSS
jgi:hypothetical protein